MPVTSETKTYRVRVEPIANLKKGELEGVLKKARAVLEHADWHDARNEAIRLSELGGVQLTTVVSCIQRTVEADMDSWQNGKFHKKTGKE